MLPVTGRLTPTRHLAVRNNTMYAKSFMALDGNGRLTGARTAQSAPYDRYTCHLCNSALEYHPEYQTEHPWFEHRHDALTKNGRQHCPYVNPELKKPALSSNCSLMYLMPTRWFSVATGTTTTATAVTTESVTAWPVVPVTSAGSSMTRLAAHRRIRYAHSEMLPGE
ncbi:hypothetical protein WP8W19C02_04850 [Enterobacter cloacae]|nr:hypothetical protein WP8W19C02_04850 [Enterobacter cloacae]